MPYLPREPKAGQPVVDSDIIALIRYVKAMTPRESPDLLYVHGSDGYTAKLKRQPVAAASAPGSATSITWPHKVYNSSTVAAGGQVQINGGDGALASINDQVTQVSSLPTNETSGNPATYPQLPVSGNGDVYLMLTLVTTAGVTYLDTSDAVNAYFGTLPDPDTANPPTFAVKRLATITNYKAGVGGGPPTFTISDANGPVGLTTFSICGITPSVS
jgi:hypothetical protein